MMNILIANSDNYLGHKLIKQIAGREHSIYILVNNKEEVSHILNNLDKTLHKQLNFIYSHIKKEFLNINVQSYNTLHNKIDNIYCLGRGLPYRSLKNILDLSHMICAKTFTYINNCHTNENKKQLNELFLNYQNKINLSFIIPPIGVANYI